MKKIAMTQLVEVGESLRFGDRLKLVAGDDGYLYVQDLSGNLKGVKGRAGVDNDDFATMADVMAAIAAVRAATVVGSLTANPTGTTDPGTIGGFYLSTADNSLWISTGDDAGDWTQVTLTQGFRIRCLVTIGSFAAGLTYEWDGTQWVNKGDGMTAAGELKIHKVAISGLAATGGSVTLLGADSRPRVVDAISLNFTSATNTTITANQVQTTGGTVPLYGNLSDGSVSPVSYRIAPADVDTEWPSEYLNLALPADQSLEFVIFGTGLSVTGLVTIGYYYS